MLKISNKKSIRPCLRIEIIRKLAQNNDLQYEEEALKLANIELYAGITGNSDNAVSRLLEGKLEHNENANCNHNSKEHNCSHKCNENKNGCSGN